MKIATTKLTMLVLLGTALLTGTAMARETSAPGNTSPPTVSGTPKEADTLTAHNGGWTNSPTAFAYQWQRCAPDGPGCADIAGAAKQTYVLASADVDNTLRVNVTASNADGQASASSAVTALISSRSAPVNTAMPVVSGTPAVGQTLSASTGTWTGGATSFTYQWQQCSGSPACSDVSGATGRTYGVRLADVGSSLRVGVTAHNLSGSTATAYSDQTALVTSAGSTTTVTTTVANKPPTLSFYSLKRIGRTVYARFRVCDDHPKVTVVERDSKAHVSSYTRRFATIGCGSFTRHWVPAPRFRTRGRYTVTLQAVDSQGARSRPASKYLTNR